MGSITDFWNKMFHSKRINFLGLKGAGKTQLLASFGAIGLTPGTESHGEGYESFSVRLSEIDKRIFVKCGVDYGGGLSAFVSHFKKLIQQGDFVFFVIDINDFLLDKKTDTKGHSYQTDVLARLDIINELTNNKQKDRVHILLTHADLHPEFSASELIDKFSNFTESKPYYVLTKNCRALDARDQATVKKILYDIIAL